MNSKGKLQIKNFSY